MALDGAVLAIDDRANEAVYGQDTTPRMIFEDRTPQPPSDVIGGFRTRLTEASASARSARQDDDAPAAPPATPDAAASATAAAPANAAQDPQPQPFQPVENPAKVEPLPEKKP